METSNLGGRPRQPRALCVRCHRPMDDLCTRDPTKRVATRRGGMMRLQMHPFLCALLDRPLLGSHAVISLLFTSSPRRDTSRDTPLSRSLTEAFHVDRYGRRLVLSDLIGFTRLSSTSPNPPRCNNASQGTGHSCFCTLPGIANNHLE